MCPIPVLFSSSAAYHRDSRYPPGGMGPVLIVGMTGTFKCLFTSIVRQLCPAFVLRFSLCLFIFEGLDLKEVAGWFNYGYSRDALSLNIYLIYP